MVVKTVFIGVLAFVLISFSIPLTSSHAQGILEDTVARRDLVIDLGNGLKTDAQLTFPVVGEGPYPGVLLVHGSGETDMDEYLPPTVTGTGEPSRPFLQIAEYLSERGFAVLRYNKRGIGLNGTLLNPDVYLNMTFQDLMLDAEKALEVLMEQPEVDENDITVIGHSEGTYIAPRVAIEKKVNKIVLLSAGAHNLYNITYFQLVDRRITIAEDVLDSDYDGSLSIQEVAATMEIPNILLSPLPPQSLIENSTGQWLWYPGLDADEDGYLSIQEELKPLTLQAFEFFTSQDFPFLTSWLKSHFALDSNLVIIGNVSASILILQGEGDIQTPVEEAFLLEQRLTEVEHPDHTLITYPGLGHSFYPVTYPWRIQPLGPIREYVLSDLVSWLRDSARTVRLLNAQIQTYVNKVEDLQSQLQASQSQVEDVQTHLNSDLEAANKKIGGLESQVKDLNSELSLRTSELEGAKTKISNLEEQLAIQTELYSVELQAFRDEAEDVQTRLTSDLDAANLKIDDQEGQIKDLQLESSSLKNIVIEVERRNSELQSALDASTNLAYIAIGTTIIAVSAVVIITFSKRQSSEKFN
jgi:pimeloyl-ACP methyl ester carboxylesterase/predicted  nucleic acid-binding Zn-ribbon protein